MQQSLEEAYMSILGRQAGLRFFTLGLQALVTLCTFCDPLKLPFAAAPSLSLLSARRGANPQLFGHCVLAVRRLGACHYLLTLFIVGECSISQG